MRREGRLTRWTTDRDYKAVSEFLDPDLVEVIDGFDRFDLRFMTKFDKGRLRYISNPAYIQITHPKFVY